MPERINVDGVVRAPEDAWVSAMDHGFLFGDSVYETFRTYRGRFFRLADHLRRLHASADALELTVPVADAEIERRTLATIDAAGETNAAVRVVVTRGVGPMELDPARCTTPSVLVYVRPRPVFAAELYRDGVAVAVVERRRNPRRSLDPNVKSGNYLNNMLALVEAKKAGAFEPLMLNAEGFLTEGSTSNVFLVQDGVVRTPALDSGLLAGITRSTLLELCRRHDVPCEEARLRREDLSAADEVFITSTLKQVLPVTRVDGRPVGAGRPGPVAARLLRAYQDAVREETGVGAEEA